jgi:hypothetical protein
LKRAHHGPSDSEGTGSAKLSHRDRRVAARTTASPPAAPIQPESAPVDSGTDDEADQVSDSRPERIAKVIPLPIFDPFTEADKRW